jgi:hypothetical protein
MRKGNDLNLGVAFSVNDEIREPSQRNSTYPMLRPYARDETANTGLGRGTERPTGGAGQRPARLTAER